MVLAAMGFLGAILCGLTCFLHVCSEAQLALWVAAIARPIIYLIAFLFPAVIWLRLGSKRQPQLKTGSADGPWSAGSINAAGPAALAVGNTKCAQKQRPPRCKRAATSGRIQELILGSELVGVSSSQQVPTLLRPEASLRDWKGRSTKARSVHVSDNDICSSPSAADGSGSLHRPSQGSQLHYSLGFAQPAVTTAHCNSPSTCGMLSTVQTDYSMSQFAPSTPPPSNADESAAAIISPDVMLGISAISSQWSSKQNSNSCHLTASLLSPIALQAATGCAASSPFKELSHAAYGPGAIAPPGHALAGTTATTASTSTTLVHSALSETAGLGLRVTSRAAGCRNDSEITALPPSAMHTTGMPAGGSSFGHGIQSASNGTCQPAVAAAAINTPGPAGVRRQHTAVVEAANDSWLPESSSVAGAAGGQVPNNNTCQQFADLLLPPAAIPAAAVEAAVVLPVPKPPDLSINTGRGKVATHLEQHNQQQHEQQPVSARSDMTSEGSVDQPSTPVFVSTSSRTLLHPAGKTSCSSHGSTCGLSSASGVLASPPPLPSPAQSPLARRVTADRDELGFPTSPALLQLLQEPEQHDDQGPGGGCDQQQVPWAGLQLRCVAQAVLAEDKCSSELGTGYSLVCISNTGRISTSSDGSGGADSSGTCSSAQSVAGVDLQRTVGTRNSGSSWDTYSRETSNSCACPTTCVVQPLCCGSAAGSVPCSQTWCGRGNYGGLGECQGSSHSKEHEKCGSMPYQQLLAFFEAGTRSPAQVAHCTN